MTAPTTSKDSYTIYGMLYTIEEVQRTTTESMLYLQEKVGITFDESAAYLRMLRADERVRVLTDDGRLEYAW